MRIQLATCQTDVLTYLPYSRMAITEIYLRIEANAKVRMSR